MAKTEIRDRNGSERIIKRNKLKIAIIVIASLLVVTLIGVGIYFIVEATKKYDYEVEGVDMKADIDDVREDIFDNSGQTGVFFYNEDDSTANYLMRGDSVYSEGADGHGPLAEFMTETTNEDLSEITWYGINLDKYDDVVEDLFLVEAKDSSDMGYMFYDEFEYLAGGDRDADIWYFNSIDYNSFEETSYSLDESATSPKFSIIENEDDKDNPVDVMLQTSDLIEGEDGDTSESTWYPSSGTMMLFNGVTMTSLVDNWVVPESKSETDSGDVDEENLTDIQITFKEDILEFLLDHNEDMK